jgi:C1A family cysteine protease
MFSLGCRKDPQDLRDIPMGLVLPAIPVPQKVDYTSVMSPVRNQGSEGTCVAFASVVGVKECQDKKEYHRLIQLSPRYLYYFCKKFDGQPFQEGTYPRIAMKILAKYGVTEESCWPYKPFQKDFPCAQAEKEAKRYRIKAYARLHSLLEMKRNLMINGPFLAGVRVFKGWFSKRVIKNGLIPLPKKKEQAAGGHAVCVVGFDDVKQTFKFKNSWGRSWADQGYGHLSYAYMRKYCVDAWSATDLIVNPKALVKKREEIILKLGPSKSAKLLQQ